MVELSHPKPIAEHIAHSGAYDVLDIEPSWVPSLADGGVMPVTALGSQLRRFQAFGGTQLAQRISASSCRDGASQSAVIRPWSPRPTHAPPSGTGANRLTRSQSEHRRPMVRGGGRLVLGQVPGGKNTSVRASILSRGAAP
ncbi:MAG TPA: hypothetical protein VGM32_17410, partial [Rhodopila sp.]